MNMKGMCKKYFHVNSTLLKCNSRNKDMYPFINIFFKIPDVLDEDTGMVIQLTDVNSFSRYITS